MKYLLRALSKASDAAFVVDEDFRILFWNEEAERILGYTAEQATGRYCFELLRGHEENGRVFCQRFCPIAINSRRGRTPPNFDIHVSSTAGEGRWINLSTFAYPTDLPNKGSVIVHLFRDATVTKNTERFMDEIVEASRRFRSGNETTIIPFAPVRGSADSHLADLTSREREVLYLVAQGLGTREIANSLTISPSTVRNHISNILSKLGVHSRLEAVAHLYQTGEIEFPDRS